MHALPAQRPIRILIVDDNPAIHEDIKKALQGTELNPALDDLRSLVLGEPSASPRANPVAAAMLFDSAFQGEDALRAVQQAVAADDRFAVAFVDMRMPPGWDGLETIERLWQADADLQIILCTAFSDHSWSEMYERLGSSDQLLVLKKPFDAIAACQMAHALVGKWNRTREADDRLIALESANRRLADEIEQRRGAEERLIRGSLYDSLTDLPNRALLSDRLEHVVARASREADLNYAVLFLDLDDFKVVNDSLGHDVGDRLLIEVAARIQACIRKSDSASPVDENVAARLGGDEFVVLLEGMTDERDSSIVAQRLIDTVGAPFEIDGHDLRPSVSVGVVNGRGRAGSAVDLLRDADTALYRAKRGGKACVAIFDDELRRQAVARQRIESDLRRSIEQDELFLQYQPIIELDTGAVLGFEALVRWRNDRQVVIPPREFVPIAEETGLILPLGNWVLERACAQVAEWRSRGLSHALSVNINVSKKQLAASDFADRVQSALRNHGLQRGDINLELTETLLMDSFGHGAMVLRDLEERGVQFHVDEFGTGLSSLSYLNCLPFSALKLDPSFLSSLPSGEANQATIQAIVQMAHARGLKLIAEGVETAEQLEILQALGCDYGQGYHFSHPLDADLVEAYIEGKPSTRRAG
ncbi:putative bifunctional diguanylate cyclase/phosphodiesterase [Engelhardtia mirabilis]|uniref:Cyclic di-GMP phosphodiesterase Gmr n=1 Tax=Engelhardtia mirabilis TaxID=2528011 RepID=A0A518BEI9_9BACT|nr:Cyclic di-GMP phosphodiesterase Gmr [Planctomycetes bacterium Pla133]QDU99735.1 Cyclic di-GMP phosphodiesterase Gmr [Planctomycetes bacterium Pla86]